jgi:putative FmdB family regulatory protein
MAPIKEFICRDCGHIQEEYTSHSDPDFSPECSHCESQKMAYLPSAFGSYRIKGDNSASTKPKSTVSKRRVV